MMPDPYGITFFCDDIRNEVGGKSTFVGVYRDNLNVLKMAGGKTETQLPKLAAVVRITIPSELDIENIIIELEKITGNKKEVLVRLESEVNLKSQPSNVNVIAEIHVVVSPFLINSDCILNMRGYIGDIELGLGTLKVNLTDKLSESST